METIIDLKSLLSGLSFCLDFGREGLQRHHQRVAYIGLSIAGELCLSEEEKDGILIAALVHDAGVSTWCEKDALHTFEVTEPWDHCERGYNLLLNAELLKPVARIILYHHDRYDGMNKSGLTGNNIPLASRVIHIADRIDILIKNNRPILLQNERILDSIESLAGQHFDPEIVSAFKNLARRESFWLDLSSPFFLYRQIDTGTAANVLVNDQDMREITGMFAAVIDRKSPFTYRHSSIVAAVAVRIAAAMDFTGEELLSMEIAGLMHDLGKLSIPDSILEKPGPLTDEEYRIIRQHTYYTYRILREAGVPAPIPEWAAYHHEKLDGSGYPFHLSGPDLSLGARIMAVADVFTALREDRPYRSGMNKKKILDIMNKMSATNALDPVVVKKLFEIYQDVDALFIDLKES
ncbi:MAG: HD domain-containing protein [Firmicutes bacterium]|nr:HD domain-containing protein [Bacillota bacterium]